MKLTFLGTRGEIEARTPRHRRHSSLLVSYYRRRVMLDCGLDWLGRLTEINPDAIFITHAHLDHAGGLKLGAPCPVFASPVSLKLMRRYPIDKCPIEPDSPVTIGPLTFQAFDLEHSLRCPAVGYRVSGGGTIHYAPDLVFIYDRAAALSGVDIYIGDGASPKRPIIRKRGDRLIGHASIETQLEWCRQEGVPRAIFTHCGSQIVAGNEDRIAGNLRHWGRERGVGVSIAYDGMELTVR